MFNGQNFLNGLAQGQGFPGPVAGGVGGTMNPMTDMSSSSSPAPGLGMGSPANPNAAGGMGQGNPQLQALMQQQQLAQLRWQQMQQMSQQPQQQQHPQQPSQQPQQPDPSINAQGQASSIPPHLQQQFQQQQQQQQQQQRTPSGQQFFNPAAFLNQAARGDGNFPQQPGMPSGMPGQMSGGMPQGGQQFGANNGMGNPMMNPQALMAGLGSLNPQQLQSMIAASGADGGMNAMAMMANNMMGNMPASQIAGPSSGGIDPAAMMLSAQGQGGPNPMGAPGGGPPGMNMGQFPGQGQGPGPAGPGGPMPGQNAMQSPFPNGAAAAPGGPNHTRPSTAVSTASQGDGHGTPEPKGGPKGGKGKAAAPRKPRGSVKSEATPTPTMSAATIPPPAGAASAGSPHNHHAPTPEGMAHHRSPSVGAGLRRHPQQQQTGPPGPQGSMSGPPPDWRPRLPLDAQQEAMNRAWDHARSHGLNPAEALGKMGLLFIKGDMLPPSAMGHVMPNGAAIITFDEAKMLGLRPPVDQARRQSSQSPPRRNAQLPSTPINTHLPGPQSAGMPPGSGPFPPQSPAGGLPHGQSPGSMAHHGRARQSSVAGRPGSRAGFPPGPPGAMGPPATGPGQLVRRPSSALDADHRQRSFDSPGPMGPHGPGLVGPEGAPPPHLQRPPMPGMPMTPGAGPSMPPGAPGGPMYHPGGPLAPPRPSPNLPPVHGGALPPTTAKGIPVTGLNTRMTPLPNFSRPSLNEDDLSGAFWEPLTEKQEAALLEIMQKDEDYQDAMKRHTAETHSALRERIDELRPLRRRRSDGSLALPEHLHWWERAEDEEPTQIGREGAFRVIFPDERRAEQREKLGGRTATTSAYMERFKRKQLKAVGQKLEELVPIRLEIDHEGWKLRDTFTWNASDDLTSYDEFARNLCEDYGLPETSFVPLIRESIALQLGEHISTRALRPQTDSDATGGNGTTTRGQLTEGELEWWAQWRQAVQELEEDAWSGKSVKLSSKTLAALADSSASGSNGVMVHGSDFPSAAELRITIKLDITVGAMNLIDQFDWDILDESANPEEFSAAFAADLGLAGEFKTAIAHSIREQVDVHLRSLALAGHPFDGSVVTDEELRAAFLPGVASNAIARIGPEIDEYTPKLLQLSEAEVDRQERERERENKRKRRQTRGRRGINMPDREPLKTQRTPVISGLQAAQIEAAGGIAAVAAAAGGGSAPSEIPGVRTSTRRAAAAANANLHAQSEFDTPTPAPEVRPSVAPPSVKRQRLDDHSVHFRYPGGLGREDTGGPRFAPTAGNERPAAEKQAPIDAPRAPSPTKEPKAQAAPAHIGIKGARPEDVANQHPNIHDGMWHCSNCGIPATLMLGRRKGPLGEKTLCGPCGKFWHRFRRMKQVTYTRDDAYHRAIANGLSGDAILSGGDSSSSAMATPGGNTPGAGDEGARAGAVGQSSGLKPRPEDEDMEDAAAPTSAKPPSRALSPDLPFQPVGSPSDSDSDHSQSPRQSRRSSPRKPTTRGTPSVDTAAGKAGSSSPKKGHLGLPATSSSGPDGVAPSEGPGTLARQASSTGSASHAAAALASPGMAAAGSPLTTPMSPSGAAASTSALRPPTWLVDASQSLRARYPHDRFEVRPKGGAEWRLRCLDCPGKLYTPGPGESLTNFEVHLKNRAHRANVAARLEKDGDGSGAGAGSPP